MRFAFVSLALLVSVSAAAADDEVQTAVRIEADGSIVIEAQLPASAERVRASLVDGVALSNLSPDVYETTSVPRGPCIELTRSTRGLWRALSLRTVRCPTSLGFREELAERGDYKSYSAEWAVEEHDQGSRLSFRIRTEVDLPVPDSVVQSNVKNASRKTFIEVVKRILSGKL